MAKFYTNLPTFESAFSENVTIIENGIEKRYSEIQATVDASKQNILQKLRRLAEMEGTEKNYKRPDEALKLGFDESIFDHLHSCVNIQLSKEFRKSCSLEYDETPPEAIVPQSRSKDSLDIPSLEMKRSYSPLPEFDLSPSPITPTHYKKNTLPAIVSISKGKSDENVEHAYGIAVHPTTGDIYIADSGNGAIKVFDPKGEFKLKFGSEACKPYGIAVLNELVYITNWGIDSFQVYDCEGTLVRKEANSTLNKPRGITVDDFGNAYVCSTGNNRVVFVNKEGHDFAIFAAKHTFREPRDVKIHKERIAILDDDNPSLHFFTPQGEHQTSIVANFIQIVSPFAHAYIYDPGFFDMKSDGTIFVSDRQRHYIKIYSPEGKYVTRIGKEGDNIGTFRDPEGVAIGPDGKLYTVCNRKKNMLQIF